VLLEGSRNVILLAPEHVSLVREDCNEGPSLDVKPIPRIQHTSKYFDTSRNASSWLNTNRDNEGQKCTTRGNETYMRDCSPKEDGKETCSGEELGEDEEVLHHAGGHLTVDIRNVDEAFLHSEERLAQAMVDVVNELDVPLLSYHCQGLTPAGVICIGVLLENFMSLQTWPREGAIALDLVVSGTKSILQLLPVIRLHFGVPCTPSFPGQVIEQPEMRWAHKLRGFHPDSDHDDLDVYVLSNLETNVKEEVSNWPYRLILRAKMVR
jgi:S-adenosylmethionine/arginine decarboxylase-like enzyme